MVHFHLTRQLGVEGHHISTLLGWHTDTIMSPLNPLLPISSELECLITTIMTFLVPGKLQKIHQLDVKTTSSIKKWRLEKKIRLLF
jgi:hypothetical protein